MSIKTDSVKIGDDTTIVVKELTGPQLDAVFARLDGGYTMTVRDRLMKSKHLPEFVLDEITAPVKLGDLIKEKNLAPSEYAPVYDKAIEVNSFLSLALQDYQIEMVRVQELEEQIATMGGSEDLLSALSALTTKTPSDTDSAS